MIPGLPRIWIITDPSHPDGPVTPVRRALEGCRPGLVGVQLRAKHASDRQLVQWGRELREATRASGSTLAVNRRVDVAQIVDADGVHLPELGLPIAAIREQWPELPMTGVSRHDRAGLMAAKQDRATYAFLSPVFKVPGKAQPIGIHGFRRAIADVGIPTYALGGIGDHDWKALLGAGAFGVAIRRAIYAAPEPSEALQRFVCELDKSLANGE
ncbi:MAG: thiamine phosphate synthase [Deltaproteobacteria bacterium]|nr:thiamine phosphate synthase [Deltaproteobacteria bacterium]